MAEGRADFTATFRALDPASDAAALARFATTDGYEAWAARWRERLAHEPRDPAERRAAMHAANPLYVPRNHRVEAVLAAAIQDDDLGPFDEFLAVLARPFDERPAFADYAEPPAGQGVYRTY
jgi:uncharacterized protein YdiU (UPF0061 family)